ncbi:MAG: hypothetical protein NT040_11230 [Bacteroidetes bacterium]|nr:hypothetical protein [Bacteroidota bacterium]
MLHDLNLSVPEVFAMLLAIAGIVGVWVSVNVRIAKIETTVTLKIAAIEMSIATYIKSNSDNLRINAESVHCSFADNKEEHRAIANDVKEMRRTLGGISVEIAKLTK